MSMPRVGSSRMRIVGSVSSQRARIAFCWLPPESSPIGWRSEASRTRSFLTEFDGQRLLERAADDSRRARSCLGTAAVMFCSTESVRKMPADGAVLGHEGEAESDRLRRVGDGDGACRRSPRCRSSAGATPKMARATSVRPAPTRPPSPTISPLRTSKLMSLKTPGSVRPSTFERHLADRAPVSCACIP